jgi:hypothetical protein
MSTVIVWWSYLRDIPHDLVRIRYSYVAPLGLTIREMILPPADAGGYSPFVAFATEAVD